MKIIPPRGYEIDEETKHLLGTTVEWKGGEG